MELEEHRLLLKINRSKDSEERERLTRELHLAVSIRQKVDYSEKSTCPIYQNSMNLCVTLPRECEKHDCNGQRPICPISYQSRKL